MNITMNIQGVKVHFEGSLEELKGLHAISRQQLKEMADDLKSDDWKTVKDGLKNLVTETIGFAKETIETNREWVEVEKKRSADNRRAKQAADREFDPEQAKLDREAAGDIVPHPLS